MNHHYCVAYVVANDSALALFGTQFLLTEQKTTITGNKIEVTQHELFIELLYNFSLLLQYLLRNG